MAIKRRTAFKAARQTSCRIVVGLRREAAHPPRDETQGFAALRSDLEGAPSFEKIAFYQAFGFRLAEKNSGPAPLEVQICFLFSTIPRLTFS